MNHGIVISDLHNTYKWMCIVKNFILCTREIGVCMQKYTVITHLGSDKRFGWSIMSINSIKQVSITCIRLALIGHEHLCKVSMRKVAEMTTDLVVIAALVWSKHDRVWRLVCELFLLHRKSPSPTVTNRFKKIIGS